MIHYNGWPAQEHWEFHLLVGAVTIMLLLMAYWICFLVSQLWFCTAIVFYRTALLIADCFMYLATCSMYLATQTLPCCSFEQWIQHTILQCMFKPQSLADMPIWTLVWQQCTALSVWRMQKMHCQASVQPATGLLTHSVDVWKSLIGLLCPLWMWCHLDLLVLWVLHMRIGLPRKEGQVHGAYRQPKLLQLSRSNMIMTQMQRAIAPRVLVCHCRVAKLQSFKQHWLMSDQWGPSCSPNQCPTCSRCFLMPTCHQLTCMSMSCSYTRILDSPKSHASLWQNVLDPQLWTTTC